MAISVPSSTIEHPRLAVRSIPALPKANAVRALAERLEDRDFHEGAAWGLARAAVDPSDVRRRLDRPSPIRVPGAVLWTVEADVWTPAIVPYIVNYRESVGRIFPADDTAESSPPYPPIRRPKGDPTGKPILQIEVEDRGHLVQAVEGSVNYLVEHNPLSDSIAEKGVMFPITLVSTSVALNASGDTVEIPATADGSSRAAGALDVLGLAVEDVLDRYRKDPRALSGLIGKVRSVFNRPLDEVSERELGQANALILPARIIIGFEPDATGAADFAKAVHNYVQLIHGDLPPVPWPETAKVDAKADSVVSELERADLLTPNKALYLEGMLSAGDAQKLKLPATADERGLLIVSTLSSPSHSVHAAIRAGVVQPSERKNVTKWVKSEIGAELALRGVRAGLTPKELSSARDVLANAYTNPAIWEKGLKPSGKTPTELLGEALEELRAGTAGAARAELGALGGFWLVVHRVLREARFFKEENFTDGRVPSTILSALMDSEWGLQVLAQALKDGREGEEEILRVDVEGNRIPNAQGGFLQADHAWLRGAVVPPEMKDPEDEEQSSSPPPPEKVLLDRRKALEGAVAAVEQRHEELRQVLGGDGDPLVDKRGLPTAAAEDLRERLDAVERALVVYGALWAARTDATDDPAEKDEDEEDSE
ncbi:MAG TPA: hypothetical protein VFS54_05605 [Solirubrobacterales bacterium]|nr:hypothetical protein [Solirubrobacterales bacterium]